MLFFLSPKTHCGETPCSLLALWSQTPCSLLLAQCNWGEIRVSHFGLETCPPPCQWICIKTCPKLAMDTLELTEQAESKMWLGKINCMWMMKSGRWPSGWGWLVPCPSHWWHSPGPHCVLGLDKPPYLHPDGQQGYNFRCHLWGEKLTETWECATLKSNTEGNYVNLKIKCNFWHHVIWSIWSCHIIVI